MAAQAPPADDLAKRNNICDFYCAICVTVYFFIGGLFVSVFCTRHSCDDNTEHYAYFSGLCLAWSIALFAYAFTTRSAFKLINGAPTTWTSQLLRFVSMFLLGASIINEWYSTLSCSPITRRSR